VNKLELEGFSKWLEELQELNESDHESDKQEDPSTLPRVSTTRASKAKPEEGLKSHLLLTDFRKKKPEEKKIEQEMPIPPLTVEVEKAASISKENPSPEVVLKNKVKSQEQNETKEAKNLQTISPTLSARTDVPKRAKPHDPHIKDDLSLKSSLIKARTFREEEEELEKPRFQRLGSKEVIVVSPTTFLRKKDSKKEVRFDVKPTKAESDESDHEPASKVDPETRRSKINALKEPIVKGKKKNEANEEAEQKKKPKTTKELVEEELPEDNGPAKGRNADSKLEKNSKQVTKDRPEQIEEIENEDYDDDKASSVDNRGEDEEEAGSLTPELKPRKQSRLRTKIEKEIEAENVRRSVRQMRRQKGEDDEEDYNFSRMGDDKRFKSSEDEPEDSPLRKDGKPLTPPPKKHNLSHQKSVITYQTEENPFL